MIELTLAQIEEYHGGPGRRYGKYVRFKCCIHRGMNPINLQYNPDTGHFKCFKCGEWGYVKDRSQDQPKWEYRPQSKPDPVTITPLHSTLQAGHQEAQAALPGSPGEAYLKQRGIPLELAQKYGGGYAVDKHGVARVFFPHTRPDGVTVNIYGRAIYDNENPKHRHNAGRKGIFNATALAADTVFLCEGVFDALSLIAAGHDNACAIFGNTGLSDKWKWVQARRLIFAFDNDQGGENYRELADQAYKTGKQVFYLPSEVFGAHKDLNEVWKATGRLDIELPELEPGSFTPEPEQPCEAASAAHTIQDQAPGNLSDDRLNPPIWAPATYLEALEIRITTLEHEPLALGSLQALRAELAEANTAGTLYPLTAWNKHIYRNAHKREVSYVRVFPDGSNCLE